MPGTVYILTNKPNGILYTGVTADLPRRVYGYREGRGGTFTRRYGRKRLVWYEHHDDVRAAIQRESNIKHHGRAWKVRLILVMNPDWDNLYETLNW